MRHILTALIAFGLFYVGVQMGRLDADVQHYVQPTAVPAADDDDQDDDDDSDPTPTPWYAGHCTSTTLNKTCVLPL